MAKQLDYGWEKDWANGKEWIAISGEDFPAGEEEIFVLWLQGAANQHDLWVHTRIKKMRYSGDIAVLFRCEDIEEQDIRRGSEPGFLGQ